MNKKCFKTSIGGQAVIEGVMMRGPETSALAVRKPDDEIFVETWETNEGKRPWYKKTPFIRGCFNFIEMLMLGYKTLMKSADLAGELEEEQSAFEKWLSNKLGDKFSTLISAITMIFALCLTVVLFIILPTFIVSLLKKVIEQQFILTIIEAFAKISIFIAYLALVSSNNDIKRVFMYHGAEHKTIACYEAGDELTPENAAKYTRFHPRCGTSFMLIIIVVSILIFSMASWENPVLRVVLKIALMPLVVGISYEIIKITGKYDNFVTRIISAPGLWLQRLTTREPTSDMLEVAIASIKPCLPKNKGADQW
ncbi:MAG: DUF1385 domain-containing protein [Oscillospiraceae bacterium]